MGSIIIGEPNEDEIEVWTVSIPVITFLPIFKKFRKDTKYIATLEGFIGFHEIFPQGTLCLFESENTAKGARNLMRLHDIKVGSNICPIYIHKDYMESLKKR